MTTLILVPTQRELEPVRARLGQWHRDLDWTIACCGFGPIAAAVMSSRLLASARPKRVILVGLAGSYIETLPLGSAISFDNVACYGVGAGSGIDHQTAGEMGWSQLPASGTLPAVGDTIDLSSHQERSGRRLLSCGAASANAVDRRARLQKFPGAIAEDMEGFAVAVSCRLNGTPLRIVRGISNRAGNRDHSSWRIENALDAAAELVGATMVAWN